MHLLKRYIVWLKYVCLRDQVLSACSTIEIYLNLHLQFQKIDVSDNFVTEIQKLAFKDVYLVHINLSHNAISKIEPGAFENCVNITLLDLSFNKLTEFAPRVFDEISFATELQLSYNNFTDLSKVSLLGFCLKTCMESVCVLNLSSQVSVTFSN